MGEIAEMMLEGVLCQHCGVYIESQAPGFPRSCAECKTDQKPKAEKRNRRRRKSR